MDGVELYWLPLGAGRYVVRWSGTAYEAVLALARRRGRRPLFHAALVATVDGAAYVIEMAPVWQDADAERGVVGEGPVGARWLGRSRWFRYEVRCWRAGRIPDVGYAVASPQRLSVQRSCAAAVIGATSLAPRPVWGRRLPGAAEMWNSNSLIAWLLVAAGVDANAIRPPNGGRAPGWDAGIGVSRPSP